MFGLGVLSRYLNRFIRQYKETGQVNKLVTSLSNSNCPLPYLVYITPPYDPSG